MKRHFLKEKGVVSIFFDYPIELKNGMSILFLVTILISLIGVFLPIHYNLLIILGIIIDIVGGFIILSPFFSLFKKFTVTDYNKTYFTYKPGMKIDPAIEIKNNTNRAKLGFVIIAAGFFIQVLANLQQYLS